MLLENLFDFLKSRVRSRGTRGYFQRSKAGRSRAVEFLRRELGNYQFGFNAEINFYYASINQQILLRKLADLKLPEEILRLVANAIRTETSKDGVGSPLTKGIPQDHSLSPLLAELYLQDLDRYFFNKPMYYYQRYNDDIILLAKSKPGLKRGIEKIHTILRQNKLSLRPNKTFIGRSTEAISYLGCRIVLGEAGQPSGGEIPRENEPAPEEESSDLG